MFLHMITDLWLALASMDNPHTSHVEDSGLTKFTMFHMADQLFSQSLSTASSIVLCAVCSGATGSNSTGTVSQSPATPVSSSNS